MKKQTKTYLLLAVVLGIWGFIGFRVVHTINPPVAQPKAEIAQATFSPKIIKKRDTFSIVADYRDPFLGTVAVPKKVQKTRPKKVVKKTKSPGKNVSYTGFISDTSSNPNIFFVTVDGQQQMMSLNDTFQDVKLVRGTKNKIKVKYNGSTKTITLTE